MSNLKAFRFWTSRTIHLSAFGSYSNHQIYLLLQVNGLYTLVTFESQKSTWSNTEQIGIKQSHFPNVTEIHSNPGKSWVQRNSICYSTTDV